MGYVATLLNIFGGFLKGKNFWYLVLLILAIGIFAFTFIKLESLQNETKEAKKDAYIANLEKNLCNEKINKQNSLIDKIKKEIKTKDLKKKIKTKYKYIHVKDNTCEGELNAYKELFYTFSN